jgi:ribonuclease III
VSAALRWADTALGHHFAQPRLLEAALTHSSASGETYERLEFLGDRVLGLIIADWLLRAYEDEPEGRISRRFSQLVRRESCAAVGRAIGAGAHVRLEKAARAAKVQDGDNVLGDVCEALIGALYLDGGLEAARRFVQQQWQDMVAGTQTAQKDPKSALQEWAQGRGLPLPAYAQVGQTGPDHAPRFTVELTVPGHAPVRAEAASKQEAQKLAAAAFLADVTKDKEQA